MSKKPMQSAKELTIRNRYLKLGDNATVFHDPYSQITIANKQILCFSTKHTHAHTSAELKLAIQKGHVLETDQEEFDESSERVIYNGRGIPMDTVTNGKKVPKEPGKEAKKLEAKFPMQTEIEDEDEDEDEEETDEDEDEDEENGDEDAELKTIREKSANGITLSRKEKRALAKADNKN